MLTRGWPLKSAGRIIGSLRYLEKFSKNVQKKYITIWQERKKLTRSTWIRKKIFLTSKDCVAQENLTSSYLDIYIHIYIYIFIYPSYNKATSIYNSQHGTGEVITSFCSINVLWQNWKIQEQNLFSVFSILRIMMS